MDGSTPGCPLKCGEQVGFGWSHATLTCGRVHPGLLNKALVATAFDWSRICAWQDPKGIVLM